MLACAVVMLQAAVSVGAERCKERSCSGAPHTVLVRPGESIQAAIDEVANGGRIVIEPGTYLLQSSLIVSGKHVAIIGSGARGHQRTELVGPEPTELVRAALARGLIEYEAGGGGRVQAVELRGFDAGILNRDSEARGALAIRDTVIQRTGRGILWNSPSPLTVNHSKIQHTFGNGVSLTALLGGLYAFNDLGLSDIDPDHVGFVFVGQQGAGCVQLHNIFKGGHTGGGILILDGCADIKDGLLVGNSVYGIALVRSSATINGTFILDTAPRPSDGHFGDGVVAFLSSAELTGLDIERSARCGMSNFGSTLTVNANLLNCNLFHVCGEDVGPIEFDYIDFGGNVCGCGDTSVVCQVTSPGLEPPEPIPPTQ
jgi:hypothetical protein